MRIAPPSKPDSKGRSPLAASCTRLVMESQHLPALPMLAAPVTGKGTVVVHRQRALRFSISCSRRCARWVRPQAATQSCPFLPRSGWRVAHKARTHRDRERMTALPPPAAAAVAAAAHSSARTRHAKSNRFHL
ncbi:hypothetical protein ACN47E_001771 [Coniothyrium glycines]